jgi:hypothetical protein
VGSYQVDVPSGATAGKTVFGLICAPTTAATYPVAIINHGLEPAMIGRLVSGNDNALPPDDLSVCISWAEAGWVVAMPAYRGVGVTITSDSAPTISLTPAAGVQQELCLGEVKDALRLTEMAVNQTSPITLGTGTSSPVTLNVNASDVLMWGYSDGGCVTQRAVEHGAPVSAAATFDAPTDLVTWYDDCQADQVNNSCCTSPSNPNGGNSTGCTWCTSAKRTAHSAPSRISTR